MALVMLLIAGMLTFAVTATLVMLLCQAGARLVRYVKAHRRLHREAVEPQ